MTLFSQHSVSFDLNTVSKRLTISSPYMEFIGHTGRGRFPQKGLSYEIFGCVPERDGIPQHLVFRTNEDKHVIIRIIWQNDKLIYEQGLDIGKMHPFSVTRELGLSVEIGDVVYHSESLKGNPSLESNHNPEPWELPFKHQQRDLITLLQYLEGRISDEKLTGNI